MKSLRQRAMTLLEVLLAITLLGAVAAAGWTWSLSIQRSSAAIRASELAGQDALASLRLMRDDLLGSIAGGTRRFDLINDHELRMFTLNAVPGGTATGARQVRWTWDALHGLRRSDGTQVRTLSRRVAVRFHDGNGGLWCDWLAVDPRAARSALPIKPPAPPPPAAGPAAAPPASSGALLWSLPVDSP